MAKSKQKTHSGAKKRFKKTGSGKIMRQQTGVRHNLAGKRRRVKLAKRGSVDIASADDKRVTQLLSS